MRGKNGRPGMGRPRFGEAGWASLEGDSASGLGWAFGDGVHSFEYAGLEGFCIALFGRLQIFRLTEQFMEKGLQRFIRIHGRVPFLLVEQPNQQPGAADVALFGLFEQRIEQWFPMLDDNLFGAFCQPVEPVGFGSGRPGDTSGAGVVVFCCRLGFLCRRLRRRRFFSSGGFCPGAGAPGCGCGGFSIGGRSFG